MNSHKKLSGGYWLRLYMPMDAATKGTLSTTALTKPMSMTMTSKRPTVSSNHWAMLDSTWVCSRVATASKIPMKKVIDPMSMRESARTRVRCSLSSSAFSRCTKSPTNHSKPKPSKMPKYGGKCVQVLNTGTATNTPRPRKNIKLRSNAVVCGPAPSLTPRWGATTLWPRTA